MLMGKGATNGAYAGASPITHVTPAFPPTLLIHGNKDELVSEEESLSMYRALRKANVPAEIHIYADQPHAFDASPIFGRQTTQIMDLFLRRYVCGESIALEPAAAAAR
jgi:dipeptidyl aminopeptidase/acylaminoacyl peptidase